MLTYRPSDNPKEHQSSGRRGFVEGFMISFLNPKILVFLVAVFSQFIDPQMTDTDRVTMAVIAGTIDTTWYVLVAAVLSGTTVIDKLRENSTLIDRMIGVVLLVLAMGLIIKSLSII
jgi:threonine/homoserine/homoserine lactone efflux protein